MYDLTKPPHSISLHAFTSATLTVVRQLLLLVLHTDGKPTCKAEKIIAVILLTLRWSPTYWCCSKSVLLRLGFFSPLYPSEFISSMLKIQYVNLQRKIYIFPFFFFNLLPSLRAYCNSIESCGWVCPRHVKSIFEQQEKEL